jgi:hypothetical protein
MIKIKKSFTRLINIGNFENVKVGVELEKELTATDAESIKKAGGLIGKLVKSIVEEEVLQIKEELKAEEIKKHEQHKEEFDGK